MILTQSLPGNQVEDSLKITLYSKLDSTTVIPTITDENQTPK